MKIAEYQGILEERVSKTGKMTKNLSHTIRIYCRALRVILLKIEKRILY